MKKLLAANKVGIFYRPLLSVPAAFDPFSSFWLLGVPSSLHIPPARLSRALPLAAPAWLSLLPMLLADPPFAPTRQGDPSPWLLLQHPPSRPTPSTPGPPLEQLLDMSPAQGTMLGGIGLDFRPIQLTRPSFRNPIVWANNKISTNNGLSCFKNRLRKCAMVS